MNRIIKIFLFTVLFVAASVMHAQQEPLFTQYMFNRLYFNPAFAGQYSAINSSLFARHQWIGVKNDDKAVNPQTYLFSIDMPVPQINCGAGLLVYYDKIGYETNLNASLNYDFHMRVFDDHSLSVGLSLDFLQKNINFEDFVNIDTLDPAYAATGSDKAFYTDFGIGMFFHKNLEYYAGFSVKRFLQPEKEIGAVEYQMITHYYFTGGYSFSLNDQRNQELNLEPSFLLKLTNNTSQLDINLELLYRYQYWAGISYRTGNTFAILAGMRYSNYLFGISYDIIANDMNRAKNAGSVELYIGYRLPVKLIRKGKPNPKEGRYNTRTM